MPISYKNFPLSFGAGHKVADGSGSSDVIFLSADVTSNVTTESDVSEFTVVVPPGKICSLHGLFFFNTVVATTVHSASCFKKHFYKCEYRICD